MMSERIDGNKNSYRIIHYGTEGATVGNEDVETVDLLTKKKLYDFYGYDRDGWQQQMYKFDNDDDPYVEFNLNLGRELINRVGSNDVILLFFGYSAGKGIEMFKQKRPDNRSIIVEPGIGYTTAFTSERAYESTSVMSYCQGIKNEQFPNFDDCVIPNYYNPDHFKKINEWRPVDISKYIGVADKKVKFSIEPIPVIPLSSTWLCIGRIIKDKGVDLTFKTCLKFGQNLIVAGQGDINAIIPESNIVRCKPIEALTMIKEKIFDSGRVYYVGSVGVEDRKLLYQSVLGTMFFTRYMEPFGGVSMESLASGTPVITSGLGATNENVEEGIDGYKVRSINEIIIAMFKVSSLDRTIIKERAEKRWSLKNVRPLFEGWLNRIRMKNILGPDVMTSDYTVINSDNKSARRWNIVYIGDCEWKIDNPNMSYCIISSIPPIINTQLPVVVDWDSNLQGETDLLVVDNKNSYDSHISHFKPKFVKFIEPPQDATSLAQQSFYPDATDLIQWSSIEGKKVALITETKWSLGRIADGLVKNSIHDFSVVDWDNEEELKSFFVDGTWKDYDVLLGNTYITKLPFEMGYLNDDDVETFKKKVRPVFHAPINHPHFNEPFVNRGGIVGAVSEDTIKCIVPRFEQSSSKIKILLTRPGVDIDKFKGSRHINEIKRAGFIGFENHKPSADVKRPDMFKEICRKTGLEPVFINDKDLNDDLYNDIDILIITSAWEGGPLSFFEAAAAGVMVLSTDVGRVKEINGIPKFSSVDDATKIINMYKSDMILFNNLRSSLQNFVRDNICWKKMIVEWDRFIAEGHEETGGKHNEGSDNVIKNIAAIKQFAQATGNAAKMPDGTIYDPSEHPEEKHMGNIRKI